MASAALEKLRTELECSICLHVFTNPVTLACGHSFCLKCLNGYVKTHPTAATRKVLPCSACRHETKVPCPEQPMEDWGKQLTPSFTIKNLAEEIKTTQSTHENDDNCFLCLGHGERTRAVLWCQECEISLCQRCSRTHEILPGIKDHDVTELSENAKRKKPLKTLCSTHNEPIKFYCRECKRCACGSCGFLEHRKCDNIVSVQSVLPEMTSVMAENHQTILERMKDKEQEVSFLTSQLEFVESDEKRTLSEIDDVEKRMMTLLQEKCKKEKDEVRKTAQTEKSALKTSIKTAQHDVKTHGEHSAVLNQILESGDEENILKQFEVCQSGAFLADDRESPERDHVTNLDFRVCKDNLQQLVSNIGQVEVTKTDGMLYRLSLVKIVDIQMEEDENEEDENEADENVEDENEQDENEEDENEEDEEEADENVEDENEQDENEEDENEEDDENEDDENEEDENEEDKNEEDENEEDENKEDKDYFGAMISLRVGDVDTAIVTHPYNKSVRCFYSQPSILSRLSLSKPTHSVCRFDSLPFGITKLTDNRIMVSFPLKCHVVTLRVTPELVKDKVIQTQMKYVGLCMLNSGLVAASCPRGLDILAISGDTATRVKSLAEGVFEVPFFLNYGVHENSIIVADMEKQSVTCLTPDGDIKWTYTSPEESFCPIGVTSTRRGDVFVVDNISKKVIVLTRSGVHKADILSPDMDEIREPACIYCDGQGHLVVADGERVLIYKLTEI